jgi:hypothetical protein
MYEDRDRTNEEESELLALFAVTANEEEIELLALRFLCFFRAVTDI